MHESTLLLIEIGALLLGLSVLARVANRFDGGVLPIHAGEDFLEIGSELGVILLLLMLGLEYTAPELVASLKQARTAGLLDLVMNAAPGAILAFALGWGPLAALALAGATWISSSGVIAKVLRDLRRLSNRETPVILSVLVIEDLAMAFYLPVLSALVIGAGVLAGATALVIAVVVVLVILFAALRHGRKISAAFSSTHSESLLLGVLGLTMLVAGLAQQVNVSAAVGAFLVGIAISGQVAERAEELLAPLRDLFAAIFFVFFGLSTDAASILPLLPIAALLALVTMGTKVFSGYRGAAMAGIGKLGRWRTGFALVPRGEFSIVIASLAVSAGIEPQLAPLVAAYVLITVVAGPLLARVPDAGWFRRWVAPPPPAVVAFESRG